MNRRLTTALTFAIVAILVFVTTVLAHTATPSCETIVLAKAPANSTAMIEDVDLGTGYGPVAGNQTITVIPGIYRITWSDGYIIPRVVVPPCTPATEEPSSPPSTPPSEAPSEEPSPDPTPVSTPSHKPLPTLPPTDTE